MRRLFLFFGGSVPKGHQKQEELKDAKLVDFTAFHLCKSVVSP